MQVKLNFTSGVIVTPDVKFSLTCIGIPGILYSNPPHAHHLFFCSAWIVQNFPNHYYVPVPVYMYIIPLHITAQLSLFIITALSLFIITAQLSLFIIALQIFEHIHTYISTCSLVASICSSPESHFSAALTVYRSKEHIYDRYQLRPSGCTS